MHIVREVLHSEIEPLGVTKIHNLLGENVEVLSRYCGHRTINQPLAVTAMTGCTGFVKRSAPRKVRFLSQDVIKFALLFGLRACNT
jgi:hypothetical protein